MELNRFGARSVRIAAVVSAAALMAPAAAAAAPTQYRLTELAPGVDASIGGINDAGQISGSITVLEPTPDGNFTGTSRAVVWDSSTGRSVTTKKSFGSAHAGPINERGQVAGSLDRFADGVRVFSWKPGSDPVVMPGSASVQVQFLNDRGQIAFLESRGEGPRILKIWKPDHRATKVLGPVGELEFLEGMNDWPRIIGNSYSEAVAGQHHAFLWRGNVGKRVDFPGLANSVDKQGRIAGQLKDRATVWSNGLRPKTIKTPGKFSSAELINDKGQVAGIWRHKKDGPSTAFFWDPATGKTTSFGRNIVPVAMNDKGQVVLQPYDNDDSTADTVPVVWDKATGKLRELPRGDRSGKGWKAYGVAINNKGQVVATLSNALQGGDSQAVVWTPKR